MTNDIDLKDRTVHFPQRARRRHITSLNATGWQPQKGLLWKTRVTDLVLSKASYIDFVVERHMLHHRRLLFRGLRIEI